jgi:hypothetical protein
MDVILLLQTWPQVNMYKPVTLKEKFICLPSIVMHFSTRL